MWQSEQKVYYRNPSETLWGKKGKGSVSLQEKKKKSQIHTKAGSSGFAWIHSQMYSFLRGSKLPFSLTHVQKLEVGLTHPEGQIISFQITVTLYTLPVVAAV